MNDRIRKTLNDALTAALKENVSIAMEEAAQEAIENVMEQFVGNILNERTLAGYCKEIFTEILGLIYDMMDIAFGEVIDMSSEVDD